MNKALSFVQTHSSLIFFPRLWSLSSQHRWRSRVLYGIRLIWNSSEPHGITSHWRPCQPSDKLYSLFNWNKAAQARSWSSDDEDSYVDSAGSTSDAVCGSVPLSARRTVELSRRSVFLFYHFLDYWIWRLGAQWRWDLVIHTAVWRWLSYNYLISVKVLMM